MRQNAPYVFKHGAIDALNSTSTPSLSKKLKRVNSVGRDASIPTIANGTDNIAGSNGNNVIASRGGDDVNFALNGNDLIDGGSGNNNIIGYMPSNKSLTMAAC